MRIKIDENISRHLKALLIQEGHEATTAAEEGLLGKADIEVGAVAKAEGMFLFALERRGDGLIVLDNNEAKISRPISKGGAK